MEPAYETHKRRRMARWLSGSGIEIGALHHPLSVPPGVKVRYVDRMPESELRAHYPELRDEGLAPVSLIGNAQDLSCLSDDSVDFVIANHLFEHLDNPIRGLDEMVRVIRPGGILYLALPEPRVTFDRDRELTTVEHVLREYRDGPEINKESHFVEWVEKAEPQSPGGAAPDKQARVAELLSMDYSIHYHVWRPDTFIDFLSAARAATGIELEPVDFAPCDHGRDNEFIFVFSKGIAELPRAIPVLPAEVGVSPSPSTALEAAVLAVPKRPAQGSTGPGGRIIHLKRAIASSPAGPVLRPIYRAGMRILRRHEISAAP